MGYVAVEKKTLGDQYEEPEPKSHFAVKVGICEKSSYISVINKYRSVCGLLVRSPGQEEVYDKLITDVLKQGVKYGQVYNAFYYAIDKGTSENGDLRLEVNVEKLLPMENW